MADPSLAKGTSREDCGTERDGVWETSRSRDSEKASGRTLSTDKDKYLQPWKKEGGFSTHVRSGHRRATACLCTSGFLWLSLRFYRERQAGVKDAKLILMTN